MVNDGLERGNEHLELYIHLEFIHIYDPLFVLFPVVDFVLAVVSGVVSGMAKSAVAVCSVCMW